VTKWTIYTTYRAIGSDREGFLTNVYGSNAPSKKSVFLKSVEGLYEITQEKWWILGGYFNIILSLEENHGAHHHLENDGEVFKHLIETMCLVNLENTNGDFTWTNRCYGSE